MKDKAYRLGQAYAIGYQMAQDDWVTLENKEGEQYRVNLPGDNPNKSDKEESAKSEQPKGTPRIKLNVKDGVEVVNIYGSGEIKRETEKAVLASFYSGRATGVDKWGDIKHTTEVWLPKSHVEVVGNRVTKMPRWLLNKSGIEKSNTVSLEDILNKKNARSKSYEETIDRAKNAGIKGVRKGMKYSTIEKLAKNQGIDFKAREK